MIIYHQRNVAAFAGNHINWWLPQQLIISRVSITSAAPTEEMFGRHMKSIPDLGIGDYAGRFS
jgi:hypothetical protein